MICFQTKPAPYIYYITPAIIRICNSSKHFLSITSGCFFFLCGCKHPENSAGSQNVTKLKLRCFIAFQPRLQEFPFMLDSSVEQHVHLIERLIAHAKRCAVNAALENMMVCFGKLPVSQREINPEL